MIKLKLSIYLYSQLSKQISLTAYYEIRYSYFHLTVLNLILVSCLSMKQFNLTVADTYTFLCKNQMNAFIRYQIRYYKGEPKNCLFHHSKIKHFVC